MIFRAEKFFGYDYLIFVFVGKGFHLSHIHVSIDIDGFGFFGENHGNAEFICHRIGDGDAGSLDSQNLCDRTIREPAVEFLPDFIHEGNIHLVIQKGIDL